MSINEHLTSLSKVLTLPDGTGINKVFIDIILNEDIPIICINRSAKKKRLMPFKVLNDNKDNFWAHSSSWEYFLSEECINTIQSKVNTKPSKWDKPEVKTNKNDEAKDADKNSFGDTYQKFAEMTNEKRVEHLDKDRKRLNELLSQRKRDEKVLTKVLVDTTKDAALINHAVLEEAMNLADDEAKKLTQNMVDSTNEMVRSSAQLISEDIFNNELMHSLVEKSNGTIVQHMTRVYLTGIAFLNFYNNLVSTSSAIQKLRVIFPGKFRRLYHSLLPHIHIDKINLERVFYGGMRSITPELYFKWAVGFLIHDIGKGSAVEYHEGGGTYDRNIVIDHVKQGYRSIMTKTNYPMEASLITGYHHEYYGDSAGYGYFRAYLQEYRKANPNAKQDYCITYELEPILDYQVLAYFPAKVLEIIDVYDSLTDPNRVYKKPMSAELALITMREEFVEKHLKLDPILFYIFEMFIRESEKLGISH